MMLRRVAVVLALLSRAAGVSAQASAAPGPGEPVCPAGATPHVNLNVMTVAISPATHWNRRAFTEADKARLLYYADAIRQHFVAPASLGAVPTLAEFPLPSYGGALTGHSAVEGKLVLVVKRNGRLRDTFWQLLPFSRPFARAVATAAVVADTSHDFEGIPEEAGRIVDDTLVLQVHTIEGAPGTQDLPLMRVGLSGFVADAPARLLTRGPLLYPTQAGYQNVGNEGEMLVLVGSDGKAIMEASQVTRIDWRDFLRSMRNAVQKSTWAPATSNGCAVPSLFVHAFTFEVERR